MRRMFYLAALLTAVAALFSACNKEQGTALPADGNLSVIHVTMPDVLTKVSS